MKDSKKIKKSDFSVTVILLLGIVAVVNFFSYQIFYRLDLTEGRVYSISKASRATASGLEDVVSIKAYFSESLPSQFLNLRQEVGDILEEYSAFSGGKIRVQFVDPTGDDKLQRELMMKGIPQLTFEVYEKDKMQLVNGYMALEVSYGDKFQAIPAVKQDTSDLEYQLTTALKKVTSEEIATIGFLSTQGAADTESAIKGASDELKELYEVRTVSLDGDKPSVPDEIDTLVIPGPKEKFSEGALKAINAFAVRGGGLLVLFNGVEIEQGLQAKKSQTNIDELLKKYGIVMNKDLVADTRSGMASFTQGFFTFSSPYSFWPKVTKEGFNKEQGAVSNLESVIMPWASSITIDEQKIKPEDYAALAISSKSAWSLKDNFDITPNAAGKPQGPEQQYVLALSVNGQLANAYEKDFPEDKKTFAGKIIAVGDSDFLADNFVKNTPDNLTLFQNLVDTLSFDKDLIEIRSRAVSSRPIKDLSDSARQSIRYFNIFGVTIIVIAYGLLRYYNRRRSRFVDEL